MMYLYRDLSALLCNNLQPYLAAQTQAWINICLDSYPIQNTRKVQRKQRAVGVRDIGKAIIDKKGHGIQTI